MLDILIIVVYLGFIFWMGAYYSRRQTSTEQFFLAGRSIPGWVTGFSIIATIIGSGTFIGQPGEVFRTNMWPMPIHLILFPVMIFVARYLVVFYRHTVGMSVYSFLEKRFGYSVRVYGGLAFIFSRILDLSATLYFFAVALGYVSGLDISRMIVAVGLFTIVITYLGGITVVVWTGVVQGMMLLGGGLVILFYVLIQPEASPVTILSTAWEGGKFSWGSWDFSVVHDNVWIFFALGFVWATQRYATDQHIVQKYLLARSDKEASQGARMGGLACIPIWILFWIVGALLWAYYQVTPNVIPAEVVANKSAIVPFFIKSQIPAGLLGVILAALTAAVILGLSSDINSTASVVVDDYYKRLRPASSERRRVAIGRLTVIAVGVFAILASLVWIGVESAINFMMELISIAAAGVLGIFISGVLFKKVSQRGVLTGIVACVLFTAWATFTSVQLPALGRTLLDLGAWNYGWNNKLIGVLGNLVMILVSVVAGHVFGVEKRDVSHLTVWTKRDK